MTAMAEDEGERRLLAILSADAVGYSRLMQDDEADTVRTLTDCRRVFDEHVRQRHGRVVDAPGDNVLAAFESPVEAVRAALAIQQTMIGRNESRPEHRRMRFRVGVNLGDVVVRDGALYGDGVNVAARLEALAPPDGVIVSDAVHMQVEGKIDQAFAFFGEHSLKNIARPVRAWHVGDAGHRAAAPAPAPSALAGKPSIAVLAFENMSTDPEQEYFSDGIAEDLITELSRLSALTVIARNSSFAYKGRNMDLREVSRALGVRYVLEGSVRRAGNRVRVTAQLIDGTSGAHLWAERYDRDLSDIFAIQDELTREIVAALKVTLPMDEERRLGIGGTTNAEAYDAYRQAVKWDLAPEHMDQSRQLLDRALALDPAFAIARMTRAHLFLAQYETAYRPDPAVVERGRADAEAVIAQCPDLGHAHYALAKALLFSHDREGFGRETARALDLVPNNPGMLADLGRLMGFGLGRFAEGAENARKAMELNPHFPTWYRWPVVNFLLSEGRFEEAAAELAKVDEPEMHRLAWSAIVQAKLGNQDAAREYREQLLQRYPRYTLKWIDDRYGMIEDRMDMWRDRFNAAGIPLE